MNRKIIFAIIGIVATLIVGGTVYNITINVEIDNTTNIGPSESIKSEGGNVMSNSPGGSMDIIEQNIDASNAENVIVNPPYENPNKGIPDNTIFEIYRDTEPYSIEWVGCGQLSEHTNIYDETIGWTISFTPIMLDKNGKQSDVPFNTIFTFDMLGYAESSARPIEYEPIKNGPHIVKAKSNSSFELDLTDTFESAKQDDVTWVEIKLVKEKSVLYLPNDNDNYGDFIPKEKDLTMTVISHIKEPTEWSKMENGDYKCNDLFEIK